MSENKKDELESEAYVLVIGIIYAIIIGASFTNYHTHLVPPVFDFLTIMILVVYVTVVTSLIRYIITIKTKPYENIGRLPVDIVLLFLYFQLVYSPQHSLEFFFSIFPYIFGCYAIWLYLERKEHKKDFERRKISAWTSRVNVFTALGLTVIIWICYKFYNGGAIFPYDSVEYIDWILLLGTLTIVLGYRIISEVARKHARKQQYS